MGTRILSGFIHGAEVDFTSGGIRGGLTEGDVSGDPFALTVEQEVPVFSGGPVEAATHLEILPEVDSRSEFADQIASAIHPELPILLLGPDQAGKTTVLNEVATRYGADATQRHDFFRGVPEDFYPASLSQKTHLIDEASALPDLTNVVSVLRTKETPAVLAIHSPDSTTPLAGRARLAVVPPLSVAEIIAWIERSNYLSAAPDNIIALWRLKETESFPILLASAVREFTAGHPALVEQLLFTDFESLNGDPGIDEELFHHASFVPGLGNILRGDNPNLAIHRSIQSITEIWLPNHGLFRTVNKAKLYYHKILCGSSQTAKNLLIRLSSNPEGFTLDAAQRRELEILRRLGIVTLTLDPLVAKVPSLLFRAAILNLLAEVPLPTLMTGEEYGAFAMRNSLKACIQDVSLPGQFVCLRDAAQRAAAINFITREALQIHPQALVVVMHDAEGDDFSDLTLVSGDPDSPNMTRLPEANWQTAYEAIRTYLAKNQEGKVIGVYDAGHMTNDDNVAFAKFKMNSELLCLFDPQCSAGYQKIPHGKFALFMLSTLKADEFAMLSASPVSSWARDLRVIRGKF